MEKLMNQIEKQLSLISVNSMTNLQVVQKDKSTAWVHGLRFGKYQEKFTVALTAAGNVKKGSVRFYE